MKKSMLLVNLTTASLSIVAATAIVTATTREKAQRVLQADTLSSATITFDGTYENYAKDEDYIQVLPGQTFTVQVTAHSEKSGVNWKAADINVYMGTNTNYIDFVSSELVNDDISSDVMTNTSGTALQTIGSNSVYHVGISFDDSANYASTNDIVFNVTFKLKDSATSIYDQKVGFYLYPSGNKFTYSDGTFERTTQIKSSNLSASQKELYVGHATNTITYTPGANGTGTEVAEKKVQDQETFELYGQYKTKGAIFTRTGYTQVGWSKADGGVQAYGLEANFNENVDTVFYPVWQANTYTLSFDTKCDDIANPTAMTVTYDKAVGTLPKLEREGYTFDGWYDAETDGNKYENTTVYQVEGDTTLYAHWTVNKYTITYVTNSSETTIDPVEYEYGTVTSAPTTEMVKTGYTFNAWQVWDGAAFANYTFTTMPAENITLYADWTVNVYNITYELDGGTVEVANPATYTVETDDITLNNPTKTGYTFLGWTGSNGETASKVVMIAKGSTEDKAYTANWEAKSYNINYFVNGGDSLGDSATQSVIYDAAYTLVEPTRMGYTFDGWFTAATGGTQVVEGTYTTDGDTDVYAHWTANTYTLTIDYDGGVDGDGNTSTTMPVTYDQPIGTLENPTKEGYTFSGWVDGDNNPVTSETIYTTADASTIKATWTINEYTITFNSNGGTAVEAITQNYDTDVTAPTDPTKTGYEFKGWYKDSALTESYTIPDKMPAENVTLYAKWDVVTYTITYDLADGSVATANPETYTVNTASFTLTEPTKTGYTFTGWTGTNGTTPGSVTIANGSTGDRTYTANWEIVTYSINYNLDGGTNASTNPTTYTVESDAITLAAPTKTGYTFLGWTGSNGTTTQASVSIAKGSTGDKSYTANWKINQYTITFDSDGGSDVTAITQNFGSTVTAPANPTKEGYTFAGWDKTIPTTMPAENTTITATWTINQYTISFNTNGGSDVAAITQDYNTTVTAPTDPTKDGYTFDGWYTENTLTNEYTFSTMPANNVSLYAKWTANEYTVTFDVDESLGEVIADADATKTVTYDTAYGTLPTPTKTGYTFAGWYDEDNNVVVATDKYTVVGDQTLTAHWTANTYTLTFNPTTGYVSPTSKTVTYDAAVGTLPNASKVGYTFVGWFTEEDGGTEVTAETVYQTADSSTVYAHYEAKTYTVTFNKNTGESVTKDTITATYDSALGELPTATKTGYEFKGWFTAAEGGDEVTAATVYKTTAESTYYAHWAVSAYTLTFDSKDGSAVEAQTVNYNEKAKEPTAPTKSGYTFRGWYKDEAFTEKVDFATFLMPAEDTTFYAKWSLSMIDLGGTTSDHYDFYVLANREDSYEYDGDTYTDDVFFRESYTQAGLVHGSETDGYAILGDIAVDTSISKFLTYFNNESADFRIYDNDGTLVYDLGTATSAISSLGSDVLTNGTLYSIGTGFKVELVLEGKVVDTVITSVLGDVDSDGKTQASDYNKLKTWIKTSTVNAQPLEVILASYIRNDGAYDRVLTSDEYQTLRTTAKNNEDYDGYYTYQQTTSTLTLKSEEGTTTTLYTKTNTVQSRYVITYVPGKKED